MGSKVWHSPPKTLPEHDRRWVGGKAPNWVEFMRKIFLFVSEIFIGKFLSRKIKKQKQEFSQRISHQRSRVLDPMKECTFLIYIY